VDRLTELIRNLKKAVAGNEFWEKEIDNCIESTNNIHLAIFIEPFLQWIIEGKKVVESRFSVNKCAPYQKILRGDLIVLKKSGGPIVAIAKAGTVWFYNLDPESWKDIKDNFTKLICAQDPSFWESRKSATYATLVKLENVFKVSEPFQFPKRDRRGWIVLKNKPDLKLDL
jgi:hypothetical protein